MSAGQQLRDQGHADVLAADSAVHRGYGDHLREAVQTLAHIGDVFSTDDARDLIPDGMEPHHCNVVGAVFRELALAEVIWPVGYVESRRPNARGRAVRLWVGCE